ncbi:16S rRNA (cytosine(1402)-N(4))-methyltransferase RsmH [Devriesea agamarum]|uniref:16S rRNA (cytosine(1402)-N(4))-methyltransferase RsmH n=1 Tax=Devriesea agamarum TaxID=472569 RepID=UPI00071E6113|nr:16S rRNA (cytosine(1402)-N(4))-methyltransferase RsmH [Devriesea agamarum]
MDTPEAIASRHIPVLRDRCVQLLGPALEREGAVYIDATLGMGGHAHAVLTAFPTVRLIGIDRDTRALDLAKQRLGAAGCDGRFDLVHATYDQIPEALARHGLSSADGILMDLGVSSLQIDDAERGFAYRFDAPLDMRMDQSSDAPTAADLLRDLDEQKLSRILYEYGEERYARKIARTIVARRTTQPVLTSTDLVEVVERAVPAASKRTGGHPAKRTFQGLRIAVNGELDILRVALRRALDSLSVHGRLAVESYHSLEDRIVKTEFVARTSSSAPPGLPIELDEHRPDFRLITRGAEKASDQEQAINPRSASVRLRAIERTREKTSTSSQPSKHRRREN